MRNLFLLGCLLAICFAGCMDIKTPHVPAGFDLNTPVVIQDGKPTSIQQLRDRISAEEKQLAADKVLLKEAVNTKLKHEFYIAAGIFTGLSLLCIALAWFIPDPTGKMKRIALRGLVFCGVGVALSCLAARLVPYRMWIEIGIATITLGWVLFEVFRHQHITLKNLIPKA